MVDVNKLSPAAALSDAVPEAHGAAPRGSRFDEFRAGWAVLLAAAIGSGLGLGGLPIYTLQFFLGPLHEAFGWTRSSVGTALSFLTMTIFLTGHLAGRLADRHGARRIVMPSIVAFALGLACLSAVDGAIWTFYAGYVLIGLAGSATTFVCYSRVLTTWFKRNRGLALGLMMTGPGMVAAIGPTFIPGLIGAHGWRVAWLVLSACALIPLPLVWRFGREKSQATAAGIAAELRAGEQEGGVSFAMALRTRPFWCMVAATYLLSVSTIPVNVHFISILNEAGLAPGAGAKFASVLGVTMVTGRFLCGFLIDRIHAPLVGITVSLVSAFGLMMLAADGADAAMIAAISLGVVIGTEADLMAYLTSRFFGLKSYSQIFAWVYGAMALAVATGPIIFGQLHDYTGAYRVGLSLNAAFCCGAVLFFILMGRYPDSRRHSMPLSDRH